MKCPELVFEKFSSLPEFLRVIKTRSVNKVFSEYRSSQNEGGPWRGTETYCESEELALNGYKEGLEQIQAINLRVNNKSKIEKNMPSVNVVGYAPHVPNAIAGIPKSMIYAKSVEMKAKVISIVYDTGISGKVKAHEVIKAGSNLLNAIVELEKQGYRVSLNITEFSIEYGQWAGLQVNLKHWRQPSNPLKICYPLLHPSWIRRQFFCWMETHPCITDINFLHSYGEPFYVQGNITERRQWLKEVGVLPGNSFYTDFKETINNEGQNLIRAMGIAV